MDRRNFMGSGLAIAGGLASVAPTFSQDRFPRQPLKLIVPFSPGGPTDVFGRRYAEQMGRVIGQQVVVENRAGAGGTVGAAAVANAAPDGYTMLFGTSSTHVTSPLMLSSPPYDPLNDFNLLVVGVVPLVVVVNPALQIQTLPELLDLIRKNPGKMTYGSSGPGSINHLGGVLMLKQAGGLDALHVPYKGTNLAQMAVMSREVDFLLDTFGTVLNQHRADTLRILASCGERRSGVAPDIPTIAEAGVQGASVTTINIVALPSKTPRPIMDEIIKATRTAMSAPQLKATLTQMGIDPVADSDLERSKAMFADEISRWSPVVKETGVRL